MMRRSLTVTLPVILLLISAPAALAAWTSTGVSGASVTTTSVSQAAQPSVEAGVDHVTISWARSTLASGDGVGRYLVLRDGVEVCTSSDTGSPTASCADPSPVGERVTYTVVAAIGAYWRGPASAGTPFTYDNTAPGAPSAPDLAAVDDTGSSDTDNITNKSDVTVTGTAEAGSTVRIYRGTTELGYGTAGSGSYSIDITLVEGGNTIHATATDAAGNISESSTTTLILKDAVTPGAPSAPDLIAVDDTGQSNTDNITSKTSVTVSGTAETGSTVHIYRGTTELGAAPATGGSYSVSITPLDEGINSIHATATDAAGNTATSAGTLAITVDTIAPSTAPSTPDLATADDTGASNSDNLTNKTTVTVTGTAGVGETVKIYRGTTELGSGIATGGSYSIGMTPLDEGDNLIHAAVSDAAGNVAASGTLTIKRDAVAPTVGGVELSNAGGVAGLGRARENDLVTITFSKQIDAAAICSLWSNANSVNSLEANNDVTVTITNNGTNDLMTVSSSSCTGLDLGTVSLGADYVSATVTFKGTGSNRRSTVTLTQAGALRIKLGEPVTGTVNTTQTPAAVPSYTPSGAWKDMAGNALVATTATGTSSSF